MTEENDDEKKKKDKKEQKHPFDMTLEERQRKGIGNQDYFDRVKSLLENSKKLKEKPKREKNRVQAILRQKEEEIKKLQKSKSKNKNALALAKADKKFLKSALHELPFIKLEISTNILKLETILATRIKMPYKVIADFALKPLPSQRANNKNKNKDKNKNKEKNPPKDKNKEQSPEEIEKSKGRHLYNLTRNGRNDNLQPQPKTKRKRVQTQQKTSQRPLMKGHEGR